MGLEMSVRGNGDGRRMRRREEGKFPFMKKVGVRVSEWLAWAPLSSLWRSGVCGECPLCMGYGGWAGHSQGADFPKHFRNCLVLTTPGPPV